MARNEEKAQALLNKWVTMKKDFHKGEKERRPFMSSDCDNLQEAEKWRREIIKETTRKIAEIQNAGLGEHRLRDLNDQINKLLREKFHWQRRIKELGGPDYNRMEPKQYDADGRELPGTGGYKYFGAARELPGVKELFEAAAPQAPRRTRGDMYKGIDPDYYGYRDEDDGVLVRKEATAERRMVEEAVAAFRAEKRQRTGGAGQGQDEEEEDEEEALLAKSLEQASGAAGGMVMAGPASAAHSAAVKAYVPVPAQEDIQKALVEKKKQALLSQLA